MAKLPALVSALNRHDGRDRATLDHIARVIREAGYIPTTKRGSGASEMTAREAANLFLGANGADTPREAPLAIDRFRSLMRFDAWSREEHDVPQVLRDIKAATTFGEALERLIDGMGELYLAARRCIEMGYPDAPDFASDFQDDLATRPWGDIVAFTLTLGRYTAEIRLKIKVKGGQESGGWRTDFTASFMPESQRYRAGFYGPRQYDRRVDVTVTGLTLFELWRALHKEELDAHMEAGSADD